MLHKRRNSVYLYATVHNGNVGTLLRSYRMSSRNLAKACGVHLKWSKTSSLYISIIGKFKDAFKMG